MISGCCCNIMKVTICNIGHPALLNDDTRRYRLNGPNVCIESSNLLRPFCHVAQSRIR
jgi:hypothetical protein